MRTVVVTSGGTGIGRAIVERFVGAGDRVVIAGRRGEPLHETRRDLADWRATSTRWWRT